MTRQHFDALYLGKSVHCKTETLADEFLELADSVGYRTDGIIYDIYKEFTCFNIEDGEIYYANLEHYKNQGYEIIEFKSLKPLQPTLEKPLVDIILERLGVKIDEEFYPNIIGSPKCRINKNLVVEYLENNLWITSCITLQDLISGGIKIVKISLLTDAEREFLSNFEFEELEKGNEDVSLYFDQCTNHAILINHCKHKFNGLEKCKHYTKQELGL